MNCAVTNVELTIVSALGFVFIFVALWVNQTAIPRTDLPGFKQAGLALQLSGTKEVVRQVVGEMSSPDRLKLRTGISRDFVFIISYTAFFVGVGFLLSFAKTPGAKWLGLTAAFCMLVAATADLRENVRILQILSLAPADITDVICHELRIFSTVKWSAFFLAVGLESIILIKFFNVYSIIGLVMVISTILGLIGLRFTQIFPLAIASLSLAAILLAVIPVAIPDKFLTLFC